MGLNFESPEMGLNYEKQIPEMGLNYLWWKYISLRDKNAKGEIRAHGLRCLQKYPGCQQWQLG